MPVGLVGEPPEDGIVQQVLRENPLDADLPRPRCHVQHRSNVFQLVVAEDLRSAGNLSLQWGEVEARREDDLPIPRPSGLLSYGDALVNNNSFI